MTLDAVDIDRKLCLTAALVGAQAPRKELAAAFRLVNPHTPFDVERANKWLQGRARPRERQLYDDWAAVLDVGQPGAWIADCDVASFGDVICRERNEERDPLLRRAQAFGGGDPERAAAGAATAAGSRRSSPASSSRIPTRGRPTSAAGCCAAGCGSSRAPAAASRPATPRRDAPTIRTVAQATSASAARRCTAQPARTRTGGPRSCSRCSRRPRR